MRTFTLEEVKSFISEGDQGIIATLARMLVPHMENPMTPTHDAAANLIQQLRAKDAALRTIIEAAAGSDYWLDDLNQLKDRVGAEGAAYRGLLANTCTILKAAREAL